MDIWMLQKYMEKIKVRFFHYRFNSFKYSVNYETVKKHVFKRVLALRSGLKIILKLRIS